MAYLTITETAKLKSCTRTTIYKWLKAGKLNSYEVAGRKFVVRDGKFEEAKSEREEEISRMMKLEERVVKLEDGNKELSKLLEEVLAKVKELEKWTVRPKELEKQAIRPRTKARVKRR